MLVWPVQTFKHSNPHWRDEQSAGDNTVVTRCLSMLPIILPSYFAEPYCFFVMNNLLEYQAYE
jgi:hypothetical protein